MAEAPTKPLHKPSESHTLDEVLKSLQDLIRNELVEPQAGQQPDIAKRSVAPPKITPTVKPASRWEARGLGKAKPKPADNVDVDAVLDSLRDIVTHELAISTPRRPTPPKSTPEPSTPATTDIRTSDDEELRIEWTESLDAAAAALEPDAEAPPTQQPPSSSMEAAPPVDRPPDTDETSSAATVPTPPDGAAILDVDLDDLTPETPPTPEPALPPVETETQVSAAPSPPVMPTGEQQSFRFDSGDVAARETLPGLDVAHGTSFEFEGLPDAVELDELTYTRSPEITAPAELAAPPAQERETVQPDDPTRREVDAPAAADDVAKDEQRDVAALAGYDVQQPASETGIAPAVVPPASPAPAPAADNAPVKSEKSDDSTPPPRTPDDFDAVTPANVGVMPSIDFVPSGVSFHRSEPAAAPPAETPTPFTSSTPSPAPPTPEPTGTGNSASSPTADGGPDSAIESTPASTATATDTQNAATTSDVRHNTDASRDTGPASTSVADAPTAPGTDKPPLATPQKPDAPADATTTPGTAGLSVTHPTTPDPAAPTPSPSSAPRKPVRDIAVRTVAKLNIELRRCGERTLDPRMVDRLQFVLQELLNDEPAKKSS